MHTNRATIRIALTLVFWTSLSAIGFSQGAHDGKSAHIADIPEISPVRIQQIAAMLPAQPAGVGAPCTDRTAWGPVANKYAENIQLAEEFMKKPIPPWNDADYLEYTRDGTRPKGEVMVKDHISQLTPMVLAECSEWHGRFLARIAEQLDAISTEKSWTLPAHDPKLESFHGTRYFVESHSATIAHDVAEALYLLGDRLPEVTRKRAMAALNARVFEPVRRDLAGKEHEFWQYDPSNWNAVCWDGVVSAALTVISDRDERALFAAAGELYSNGYLGSYSDSGYAVEGIGYQQYGFWKYEDLREQLWLSSQGKIDLYNNPKARKAALFPFQFQILPGVYADFADNHFMYKPDPGLLVRLDQIFGLGLTDGTPPKELFTEDLPDAILAGFPIPSQVKGEAGKIGYDELVGLRTYYDGVGVLVDRPAPGGHLGIAIKGGGNGGHSHNDIGAYAIGLASTVPEGDPGGPMAYTGATFTSARFDSKLLNSFGHPVPEIDGHLQLEATTVQVPILSTHFSPDQDQISMDITHAYDDPKLKSLIRTMTYTRSDGGSVALEDNYDISAPIDVEESFPTHGTFRQIDATTLQFDYEDAHLRVTIVSPAPFTITQEEVNDYGNPFLRVGAKVLLVSSGKVLMRFSEAK